MKHKIFIAVALLIGLSMFLMQQSPIAVAALPDDPEAALKQIMDVKPPDLDMSKQDDPQYIEAYMKKREAFVTTRIDLHKQFYDKFPRHPQAIPLMMQRWSVRARSGALAEVMSETDAALKTNLTPEAKADVMFARAFGHLFPMGDPNSKAPAMIEEFIKAAPKDDRGGELLFQLAAYSTDTTKQAAVYKRIIEQFPEASAAMQARGALRQSEGIGKPFELSFTDVVSGKQIDVQKDMKGKVVVIDFWATWCGPCIAEMPQMKKIYDQYKSKGVEFIGISLDDTEEQGGLTKLKTYIRENQIAWPQYYQGKQWQSEFSKGWGITGIPCNFILDADGKLSSTQARGNLETLIPELIAKRDGAKK